MVNDITLNFSKIKVLNCAIETSFSFFFRYTFRIVRPLVEGFFIYNILLLSIEDLMFNLIMFEG